MGQVRTARSGRSGIKGTTGGIDSAWPPTGLWRGLAVTGEEDESHSQLSGVCNGRGNSSALV